MRINGPALQAIRERSGLSQSDLARDTGLSQGRISEVESGNLAVRPNTAKVLAEALHVPVTALLIGDLEAAS